MCLRKGSLSCSIKEAAARDVFLSSSLADRKPGDGQGAMSTSMSAKGCCALFGGEQGSNNRVFQAEAHSVWLIDLKVLW